MKLITIIKHKVIQNACWLIWGKIIQMLLGLVVGILTARYLGPKNYGLLAYATAYIGFFMCLCTLGINSVLVKELLDNPCEQGKVLGTSLIFKGLASLFSAILIVLIVFLVDTNEPLTITVVSLCSLGLLFTIFDTFNYFFQSQLRSKVTAISSFAALLITATYRILLLVTDASVVYFALATSVDYIFLGVFLFWAYRKYNGGKLSFSWGYGKHLLSMSHHFILPSLMVAVYAQTDKFMLKYFLNTSEVGYYGIATSISCMWCFVLSAIIDSVYPTIVEAFKVSEEHFEKRCRLLYATIFYISMFASLCISVLGEFIIKLLYGSAFLGAVTPLSIITWYTAFSYLGVARQSWVVCKNKQKYLIYLYASAALINVLLNFVLIPQWGTSGAAFASLLAQILTGIVLPFFIRPLRRNAVLMVEGIVLRGLK